MTELLQEIESARRELKRAVWVYGLCRVLATLLTCAVVAGTADWLIHINDHGIRSILCGATLLATAWVAWKSLIAPLRIQPTSVELARQIERQQPELKDRLASSVNFLESQTTADRGSPALQQVEIENVRTVAQGISFPSIVNKSAPRRSAWWLVVTSVFVLAAFVWSPQLAKTALTRLSLPMKYHPWPRTTELQFVNSTGDILKPPRDKKRLQHLQGEPFEFVVRNLRGDVPEDALLEFEVRGAKKRFVRKFKPSTLEIDGQRENVGIASIFLHRGPVAFRAVGGDDPGTAWQYIDVVPPPSIQPRLTLIPPAYTGQPPKKLPLGFRHFECYAGSEIKIECAVAKNIQSVGLSVNGSVQRLKIVRGRIETKLQLDQPGTWACRFDAVDKSGFANTKDPVWQFQALEDQVPDVFISQPAVNLDATPDATVNISGVARDDVGVATAALKYRMGLSEETPVETIALKSDASRPEQAEFNYAWDLVPLQLSEGARVTVYLEATDDYDLGEPHVGRSVPCTISIVSHADKETLIAAGQAEVMSELQRVFELQSGARNRTEELRLQLQEAGELRDQDKDVLKRVVGEQRRIETRLFEDDDGLSDRTQRLLQELNDNKIPVGETHDRLSRLTQEFNRLNADVVPEISREITRAQKLVDIDAGGQETEQSAGDKDPQTALTRAGEKQQELLDSLRRSLDELTDWRERHDVMEDLDSLISRQSDINEDTQKLARQTLTKSVPELSRQERADLARTSERQRTLGRELNDVAETMTKLTDELDSSLSESVRDIVERLKKEQLQAEMESAADAIAANRLGEAGQQQDAISNTLESLRERLNNQSVDSTEATLEKLAKAEEQLETLSKEQQNLADRMQQTADDSATEDELETLRKEQQQMAERADASETASMLQTEAARRSFNRATQEMQQAANALQNQDAQQAADSAEAAAEQLDELLQETRQQKQSAEQQLAAEQILELSDLLPTIITQQQNLRDETQRLSDVRTETGRLKRSQLRTLRDLASSQQKLSEQTQSALTSDQAGIVDFALSSAADRMRVAGERMAARETDAETVRLQKQAISRLENLLSVLNDASDEQQPDENQTPTDSENSNQSSAADGQVPLLAQLKLLKTLQVELNQRTESLRQQDTLTETQRLELDRITSEQGRLADLVAGFLESLSSDPGQPEAPAEIPPEEQP